MNKVDTVIFDLDQTLLDKNQSLLNFANYQYEQSSLVRFIPNKQDFIVKFSELNNIVMPKEEVYEKLVHIFNIDKSLHAELLNDLDNNFHVYSVGFPGLHEMLKTLKERGYKLGIITNGRDFYQRNKISALGISDYFNEIVTSGAVNIKKPDHAIFRIVLNNLQSSSERSVFIGDSLKADVIPAKELGMFTILKSNDSSSTVPDAICDDLTKIPNIILSL
ncbi:HAD family hydrolase [Paenibacillus cremeus]|uniref:HAD family hydrolase n=1 Tax=Paenibacillus cremeus TaxID=2163881 RepID=UPI0021BD3AE9|nr:HAD family hydrolase [Paenibacillus cremeus]